MTRLDLAEVRRAVLADLHALRAARVELAACGRIARGRDAALKDDAVHLVIRIGHRDSREQRLGVGMQRMGKDLVRRGILDQIAEVHHADRVGDVLNNGEVMRDERSRLMTCAWIETSSAETGSSQRMKSGFSARARAMQIL